MPVEVIHMRYAQLSFLAFFVFLSLLAGCKPRAGIVLDSGSDGVVIHLDDPVDSGDTSEPEDTGTPDSGTNPDDTGQPDDTGTPDDSGDTSEPEDTGHNGEVDADDDSDGYTEEEGDCDDDNPTTYPDSPYDVLTDGSDQNCDGVDGVDQDGDGYATTAGDGDDCDDDNPETYPGALEVPYDGIANDCSGDPDLTDVDGDGYDATVVGGTDCADEDSAINPGVLENNTDGVDNNCEGTVDGLSFSIAWDYAGTEGNMGFEAAVTDSAEGEWYLDLDYSDTVSEEHNFTSTCYAPWVESSSPSGGCVGTHLDSADYASGRITLTLTAPTGDCWSWGSDPTSTGCTVEDPTAW